MALRTCGLVVHSFTILSYHDLSSIIEGLTLKDAEPKGKEFEEGKEKTSIHESTFIFP